MVKQVHDAGCQPTWETAALVCKYTRPNCLRSNRIPQNTVVGPVVVLQLCFDELAVIMRDPTLLEVTVIHG